MYPRLWKSLQLLVNHTENKYFCVSSHKLWEAGKYSNLDCRRSLNLKIEIANYCNKHILELLIKSNMTICCDCVLTGDCFYLHLHEK